MCAKASLVVAILAIANACTSAENYEANYDDCKMNGKWFIMEFYGPEILDNVGAKVVAVFPTVGIKEFSAESSKYLTMKYNPTTNEVSVETTKDFEKYEEEVVGNAIQLGMNVTCYNGEKVTKHPYIQKIKDLNTYAPKWNSQEYIFDFYGSIRQNSIVSNIIDLSVIDFDCSPDKLSFAIQDSDTSSKDFYIGASEMIGKATKVHLKANQDIHPPFEKTYVMIVQDRAYQPDNKQATAKITIRLHEDNTKIEFTKNEYTFNVNNNELETSDEIQLTDGFDHDTTVSIEESEYSKFFDVNLNYLSGHVSLVLKENLPAAPTTYALRDFRLTLKVTRHNKVTTTMVSVKSDKDLELQCLVPGVNINEKQFTNPIDIKDIHNGEVYKIENITNVESFACENETYLKCSFNKEKRELTIKTTEEYKKYEDNEIESTISMRWIIHCPYNHIKNLTFKQNIIDTNNHIPEFNSPKYIFTLYNGIPENYHLNSIVDMTITEKDLTTSGISIKLKDNDYFKVVSRQITDKEWNAEITSKTALTAPLIKTLTLVASDGSNITEAQLIIEILTDSTNKPSFSKNYYYLKFLNQKEGTLQAFSESYELPTLMNGMDKETHVEIIDNDFVNKFIVNINPLTRQLELKMVQDVVLCENCKSVQFSIRATWRCLTAETMVTVSLDNDFDPPLKPTTQASVTKPGGSEKPTKKPPTNAEDIFELDGYDVFMFSSLMGIIIMIITALVAISAMIFITLRRFILVPNALSCKA